MPQTSVTQFAGELKVQPSVLLEQLKAAGVHKDQAEDTLSEQDKTRLLEYLRKAHGANPSSNAPPKFQYLENGVGQNTPPSVDKPGDSGVTGKGKKGESIDLTVTAPAGTKLYFMCLIHPWMQAELDVT